MVVCPYRDCGGSGRGTKDAGISETCYRGGPPGQHEMGMWGVGGSTHSHLGDMGWHAQGLEHM